jgi:hypothetical protein
MEPQMMAWIAAGVGLVIAAAWVALLWRAVRAMRAMAAFEARVARLTEALTLLADTTESGFRAVTEQLNVQTPVRPVAAAPRPRRTTTGRVARAARAGVPVAEIAAAEEVSQGEVQLRLHMAKAAGSRKAEGGKRTNGSVRLA